ncbi:MAG TPA: L-seryl-tRNA(Sec) selenium transferase, partial [Blastocatellia bacterium]|nr:L-seryl-tRNA(Sec) selenium transferase [Blastocatellia bacterium]
IKFMPNELFRSLPSIERLLATTAALRAAEAIGRDRTRDLLREITDQLRHEISAGEWSDHQGTADITSEIERRLVLHTDRLTAPSLRRVVNATGVIVHTNLGRAPLSRDAIERVLEIASNYSNLEYDLGRGERGHRESHCQALLASLAGSEAAIIANNNAAAVLLVLNTLAEGGEVLVSRGELIEIGGSFRIPEVMEKSGARLKEVGTTNRTRIADYERAITSETRLILRVHPSNYRIIGFTERPSAAEIAGLASRAGIPSFEDLGSGCLIDLSPYGVADEPVVAESLRAGISVVSFSGDKMLGGPQAGIIAGSREIIDHVRKNPLMRALRADKMTYAALEATLRIYERGAAEKEVPVISRIAAGRDQVNSRAERFAADVMRATSSRVKAMLEEGASVIGGGSAPEVKLPTMLVALEGGERSAAALEERLRNNLIPIIARTERDRVLIDLRTVGEGEEAIIIEALVRIAQPAPQSAASVQ